MRTLAALRQYAESVDSEIQVEELNSDLFINKSFKLNPIDIVVIGGGDGTFSTLLPQLVKLNATIGVLPLGTGNDLARELGLTQLLDLIDAAPIVKFFREGTSREITYFNLESGERFSTKISFINYVSFGFDAKVVTGFARLREFRWWDSMRGVWVNRLGYAALCITNFMHKVVANPAFTIRNIHGSHTFNNARSIIFTNIQSIMGMGKSNLRSSIFDENIECVVIDAVMNYMTMLTHYRLPLFHPRFVGSSTQWELLDLPRGAHIQIDGEPRPDILSNHYRISEGGKLSMIVGEDRQ